MLSAMGAERLSDLAVLTLTEIGTTTPTKQSKTFCQESASTGVRILNIYIV